MNENEDRAETLEFIERMRCRVIALSEMVECAAPAPALALSELGTIGLSYILSDIEQDLEAVYIQLRELDERAVNCQQIKE